MEVPISASGNGASSGEMSSTVSQVSEALSLDSALPDGEITVLIQSMDDEPAPLAESTRDLLRKSLSGQLIDESSAGVYGEPLSADEASKRMPLGKEGLIWKAIIIPDDFFSDSRVPRGLNPKDFDFQKGAIKPRRASLPVRASDFLSSLSKVGPRYIFHGILNGWPSLRCLEVVAIEQRRKVAGWNKIWKDKEEGARGVELTLPDRRKIYRAILKGAPWTAHGWSKESPGFLFWYEAQRPEQPRISYGTDVLRTIEDATCTHISMVSHRYAVKRETPKDLITYHSVCLLSWDHGKFTTVVETAFLNGIGGYCGRSNWYHDKDTKVTQLFRMMPPEMISPWKNDSAEIRCYDVEAKSLSEFMLYLEKYRGNLKRFIDPQVSFSHHARLSFRSRKHIAQYLLNYISRDSSYADLKRNCQTFAADFCSFVAGKKEVPPFHPVSRIDYQNRTYMFLYDSHMYEKQGVKKKKKQLKQ